MPKLTAFICISFLWISMAHAQLAGYTKADVMVGENGQSTASIRISTPLGTFLQPSLSLTYNSHNPNGFCGIGFSIDGIFQAITRVAATYEQDGFSDGRINDPVTGRYALNGERLKPTFSYNTKINSTDVADCYLYNADAANKSVHGAFRTEQETWSKILVYAAGKQTALGDARYYADSFRVFTKEGLVLDFGCTPDSRVEANTSPLTTAWLLNRISDRKGNYMEIRYHKNKENNENYPAEILYTGNVNKKLLPYAKVVFQYENRPDSVGKFQQGTMVRLTKRLTSILSYENNKLFRRYELTYLTGVPYSQIASVREYGSDNISSLQPVRFSWKHHPSTAAFTKNGTGFWHGHAGGKVSNIIGDFDGNGLMDMAGHSSNGRWHISLSTGVEFWNSFWQAPLNTAFNVYTGDFNGDGKADMAGYRNGRWQVGLSTGQDFTNADWSGSFTGPRTYLASYVLDINSDGLSDLLSYAGSGNWHQFISNGSGFTQQAYNDGCTSCNGTVLIGDFNADGKSDVINARMLTGINGSVIANSFSADMNGDGMSDIVSFAGNSQWKVSLSTGLNNEFVTSTWYAHNKGMANNVLGDFNKDGMVDIATHLAGGAPNWQVYLSTGNGFKNAGIWSGHSGELGNNRVADFDGDGASDLVGYTGIPGLWHVTISNAENDLLGTIENANGQRTSFEYSPVTNKKIYEKRTTGVYPNIDFISPLVVTSSVTTDDGAGGFKTIYYKYGNARFNLKGRGFRGFEKLTITDSISNAVTTTWYSTDDRHTATRPVRSEVRTLKGFLLARTDNTISAEKKVFAKDSVWSARYTQSTDSSFDINGGFVTSKKSEFKWDEFGNILQSIETDNEGYAVSTTNTFSNLTDGNWLLGLLTSSVVARQKPGKAIIITNTAFVYDQQGALIRETILPDHPILRLQTDYELDVFGNRIKKTVSGPGISPASEYFTFNTQGNLLLQTQNAMGHITRTSYRNQMPDSVIAMNGLVTVIRRDAIGRETMIRNPDNTVKTISYEACNPQDASCPPGAVFQIRETVNGQAAKCTFFDRSDRPIRVTNESFVKSILIVADKVFNPDGTLRKESDPYFSNSSAYWTEFEYDAIKRVVRKTEPGGRVTQFNYNGLTTTTVDEQGQRSIHVLNARRKLVRTIDNDNAAVNFGYDSDDNLIEVTGPKGNTIRHAYDLRGNKTATDDPNMGSYRYEYNALKQLVKEVAPAGSQTSYEYDPLGRKTKRVENEGVSQWKYDPPNAIGQLQQVLLNGLPCQEFVYDSLTRIARIDYFVKTVKRSFSYSYNPETGILSAVTYPNGVVIRYERTINGYVNMITGIGIRSIPQVLWRAEGYNQYNVLTAFKLGNILVGTRKYDPATNFLQEIKAGSAIDPGLLQHLQYAYSPAGNLLTREDVNRKLKENFTYDGLNRLTQARVFLSYAPAGTEMNLRYDELGNITFKSDVGNYRYGEKGKGPHTLTSIDNATAQNCAYDFGQNISYTSYNYVSRISNNNAEIAYAYGPERNRQAMAVKKNGLFVQIKNYYGDLLEEITDRYGNLSYRYQVKNGTDVVAVIEGAAKNAPFTDVINYVLQDNLGSVYAIVSDAGKVKEYMSFDAWGKPRNPATWEPYTNASGLPAFDRGYTFHEMMDMDFLICMNARVYNPVLGRFLSPDPYIQSPDNLQSYNRFSYVHNNPLSFTDPTGYLKWGKLFKRLLPTIIGIAITAGFSSFGVATFSRAILSGAASGFGSAFVGGIINGQSIGNSFKLGLQGGITGGVTSGLFNAVDKAFPNLLSYEASGSKLSFMERFPDQAVNSLLRSSINGLSAMQNGRSFFKAFSNSLMWEGVSVLNAEVIINNTSYKEKEYYIDAQPTFKRGEGIALPSVGKYLQSQDPKPINLLMDATQGGGLLETGGFASRALNIIPGMNYHSNVHDPFVSMLFKTSSFFGKDNSIGSFIANVPTQLIVVSNYGVLLNQFGLLNNKK